MYNVLPSHIFFWFCRTWSDREIRTLMTRLYPAPLNPHHLLQFEDFVLNCARKMPSTEATPLNVPTPMYERYQDSPLVSFHFYSQKIKTTRTEYGYLKKKIVLLISANCYLGFGEELLRIEEDYVNKLREEKEILL